MEVDDLFIDLKLNYKNEDEMKLFKMNHEDLDAWPESVSNLKGQIKKKPARGQAREPEDKITKGTAMDTMPLFLTSKY
jgi:hypothetical protein